MRTQRILVVDDEPAVLRLVTAVLEFEGFSVLAATCGEDGLATAELERPDLVLLDILLPGELDGYQVCRRLRANSSVPVIMLTGQGRENDKIRGFDAGADDYLSKPFSSRELMARIKAVLRRSRAGVAHRTGPVISCGELMVDLSQRRVSIGGREVVLTATEFRLLEQLALNAGRVMSHQELLEGVWGPGFQQEMDYLRAYIRHLRRKIEANPSEPRYIVSRPGLGYMLVA